MQRSLWVVALLLATGCGDYSLAGASDTGFAYAMDEAGGDGGGGAPMGDTASADDGYGSEDEDGFLGLAPAVTTAYVFVANPDLNTVTRISVPSLSVITTDVGVNPAVALTTEDYKTAVVFNQGSDDVSIIDAETLHVDNVAVRENFNNMVMSPDGKWAACFHDAAKETSENASDSDGTQSYNEVSLVRIADKQHFPMVVGFNPREIQFTPDGSTAVVVSDAYVVLIDLLADEPVRSPLAIAEDTVNPPAAEEVIIDPNGAYALIRQYGTSELVVVDLKTQEVGRVPVGANATDLDVTPEGDQAIAVARGSSELWVYDLADPYLAPSVVDLPPAEILGSVVMSPDGSKGLLYSTQSGLSRYAVWDRTAADPADSVSVRTLEKPVSSIGVSPDGGTALIFHDRTNGVDVASDSPFYNEYALTLVSLSDFFPNTLKLAGEPKAYDNTEDGSAGFLIMQDQPELLVLHYASLMHDTVDLKSAPIHTGVLPETHTVYVSQEHDLGRISFYDLDLEQLTTVTGFELNAAIEY